MPTKSKTINHNTRAIIKDDVLVINQGNPNQRNRMIKIEGREDILKIARFIGMTLRQDLKEVG